MQIDAVGAFSIVFFNICFWILILRQKPLSRLVKAYFNWSFFITLWAFGYGITLAGLFSYERTLVWNKYCQAMASLIGPFFFKFGCQVVNRFDRYRLLYRIYLGFGIVVALGLFFTPYFVKGLWSFGPYVYQPLGGPLYIVFTLFFLWCTVHSYFIVARNFHHATGVRRNHVILFLWATGIAYSGGGSLLLQGYGIPFPTTGVFLILAYVIIIGYSVHKYKFMEIDVLIRKTLVFAGLFSAAFAVFASITYLTQELLSGHIGISRGVSLALSVLIIILGYDPLRKFLINLTDQFLFQKPYDYRKFLRDASAGMSQIKSLHHLLNLVTHFVTMRMRVNSVAILMHNENENGFQFGYARGYSIKDEIKNGFKLEEKDPMIDYMKRERASLDYERIKEWTESGKSVKKGSVQHHYDFDAIKNRMEELQAVCCVPSFLGNQLKNILILGTKKSGDYYSDDDLNVLFTLAQESAIAIENARLYDQAVEKAKELEEINVRLESAQTDLLRALNDTESANKKLRDTHVQLIHEQKMATLGRLAASVGHEVNNPLTILSMNVSRAILKYRRDPDLKVSEILEVFSKMEQNISRIKAVVNTLTGLLKKSERGKFEPLSLKLVLEETLPLVRFQTYLENLSGTEVEFDIPGNTPLIKGDLERLQEVFLNLFINAYHAMAGKRLRKITVTARPNQADTSMVTIEFSDNGSGMSDEVLKKVFAYGFTTKPAGKGSGMGLYMCRYIIELHGGDVKVRSKLGEGTTFVITLPIYREPPTSFEAEGAQGL